MRSIILLCMLTIFPLSAFAGTWVDDFEGGKLAEWEEIGPEADWAESDGVAVSELAEKEGGNRDFLITGDQGWKDYTITVKVRTVNLVGGDWCGMVLRYNNENSFYWFGISLAWTKYAAGTAAQIVSQELLRVTLGQWYELRAEIKGDSVKFFVDGKLFFDIAEGLPAEGRVGLFTQGAKGEFDDFSVTGAAIQDGGPGFPVEPKGSLITEWGKIKRQSRF